MDVPARTLKPILSHRSSHSHPIGRNPIEKLRGHQAKSLAITAERYLKAVMTQFRLGEEQARRAIALVLNLTRDTIPNKEIRDIIYTLKFEVGNK
jgi:hypothetical protein